MSKRETDLPERLHAAGATDLERRMLEAAGREQPSRELSERMAQAIGISMSAIGTTAGEAKTGVGAANAANSSSSLVVWVSGALVAVGISVGAFIAARPATKVAERSALAAAGASASVVSTPATPLATAPPAATASAEAASANEESPLRPPAPKRAGHGTAAGELAEQIALVDAARSALATGSAQRALTIVREYQNEYPAGTFRPEVSAVKIEALVKLGRMAEARSLAERFVATHGPGPLADRVARLAQLARP